MYEHGLVNEPARWNITKEQAAQIILGNDFLARSPEGEVLDVVGLARQMGHLWSLVAVECIVCGTPTKWSVSMSLSSRGEPRADRCSRCFALPLAPWQDEFFKAHGLAREHEGYARLGERVAARCIGCGTERRISVSELKSGFAPCLNCAEITDPDSVHIVYVIRFPGLRARKVGITSTKVRHDRIASHLAQGGLLLDQHEVPNREAARTVEDFVLRAVRDFPSGCTARDFPQGGFTETWSDDGPEINLRNVVENLTANEAPGFDRLRKLMAYFDSDPATIEELVEFRHVETIEVDGAEVHQIGFREPMEQVLRKIRASRAVRVVE